jgi:hypothetical protein
MLLVQAMTRVGILLKRFGAVRGNRDGYPETALVQRRTEYAEALEQALWADMEM